MEIGSKGEKIPEQLKAIENQIEKIIMTLNGPAVILEEEKKQGTQSESSEGQGSKQGSQQGTPAGTEKQGGQKGTQSGSSDGQGSKQGSQQGTPAGTEKQGSQKGGKQESKEGPSPQAGQGSQGGQGQQGGQASPSPQKQPEPKTQPSDTTKKVTPLVSDLHYKWNSFMPLAVKLGASSKMIDNFSNSLNNLTNIASGKDKTAILTAANNLYAFIPDFYLLYKTKTSPEIKRIRYYLRSAMFNSDSGNWAQADIECIDIKSSWTLYKTTIDKKQQSIADKLDSSLYEFDKVVKEKNEHLIDLKGRVAISNIKEIEKANEKSSSQGGQSSGSQ